MSATHGVIMKNGRNYSHDTADSISYVNTTSGLTAADVQAAIDETVSKIPNTVASKTSMGLCPQLPNESTTTKYLRQDGTWQVPPNTTYNVVSKTAAGLCPQLPNETTTAKFLRQDGSWVAPPNTTYSGSTTVSLNGTSFYLTKGNVTTALGYTPPTTNTTYNVTSKTAAGLCPQLPNETTTTKYLRQDGTWQVPPDHTYTVNNGTLSLTQGSTTVATFTANQSGNTSVDIYAKTQIGPWSNGNGSLLVRDGASSMGTYDEIFSSRNAYLSIQSDLNNAASIKLKSDTVSETVIGCGWVYLQGRPTLVGNNNQMLILGASTENEFKVSLGVDNDGSSLVWNFSPLRDGLVKLGRANSKWGQIYSTSSTINTSDRNEKKDINDLKYDKIKDFIMDLKPVSYKFINNNSDRTHYGMIAQDVEETMNKLGMSALDFAGFCKDIKSEQYECELLDENGDITPGPDGEPLKTIKERFIDGEYRYGLRYEEFIAPMITMIQEQQRENDELKERVKSLESKLDQILSKLK